MFLLGEKARVVNIFHGEYGYAGFVDKIEGDMRLLEMENGGREWAHISELELE